MRRPVMLSHLRSVPNLNSYLPLSPLSSRSRQQMASQCRKIRNQVFKKNFPTLNVESEAIRTSSSSVAEDAAPVLFPSLSRDRLRQIMSECRIELNNRSSQKWFPESEIKSVNGTVPFYDFGRTERSEPRRRENKRKKKTAG